MIGRTNDNWCEAVVLRDRYQLTELADPTHRWVYRGPVQLQQRRQRRYHRRATIGLHHDRSRPCPPRVRDHLALGATPTTPHHRAHRREPRNGLTVAGQADLATHVLNACPAQLRSEKPAVLSNQLPDVDRLAALDVRERNTARLE